MGKPVPLFFFAISGREVDDRPRHLTYPLSLKIEEKERIKEEMEPVRQFRGGTSASLPNYLSKNADVSIGVARSPLVKSANMTEVVSATPPKAPCRAPRARFGRGGIPKREGLNALTAAGPSSSIREPRPGIYGNRRLQHSSAGKSASTGEVEIETDPRAGTNLVLRRLTRPSAVTTRTTPFAAWVFKSGPVARPNGPPDRRLARGHARATLGG